MARRKRRYHQVAIGISALILVAAISIGYILLKEESRGGALEEDARKVLLLLLSEGESVDDFSKIDYEKLKKSVDSRTEIAIYFEDEKNNIIEMNGKNCLGSGMIKVNGVSCGNR